MLSEHQKRKITTIQIIKQLDTSFSQNEIKKLLKVYATVCHMEFHPSDACNLTCKNCTYGHDDSILKPAPINFPFNAIKKIANFKPKSMVITGGGEPTLYKDKKYGFQEMIEEVLFNNPKLALALVTNGTYKPPGNWPDRCSWIRVKRGQVLP